MRTQHHRGARVLYVAGGVGEFPKDVQDWLSRPENPAIGSSNPYDALALLAKGLCPAALIVSVQAVDWSEMEFFDHVAQLCRETAIFVSGPAHQRAKMEAACHRGASLFDGHAVSEAVLADQYASGEASSAGIMAGSFRASSAAQAATSHPNALNADLRRPTEEKNSEHQPDRQASPRGASPPGVRLVSEPDTMEDESRNWAETPVRRHDHDEGDARRHPSQEADRPEVPVPWLPSAQRPKRVPPGAPQAPEGEVHPNTESTEPRRRSSPVELSQEEIEALLGRPGRPSGNAGEGHGS